MPEDTPTPRPKVPLRVVAWGQDLYVDSWFLQTVGAHDGGLGWAVAHLGFGDFRVTSPDGAVEFDVLRIDTSHRGDVLAEAYKGIEWPKGRPHAVRILHGAAIFRSTLQSAALLHGMPSQWFDAPPAATAGGVA